MQVELFETAVEIGAGVIPGVCGIVFVCVGPGIGKVDFACFCTDVCERIENVGEMRDRNVLRLVVATVDCPIHIVRDCADFSAAAHCNLKVRMI